MSATVDFLRQRVREGGWPYWLGLIFVSLLLGTLGGLSLVFLHPFITVALVVGLVGGLLILRSVQVGLLFLIGVATLLPFGAIPISLGFYPTFLDVALLALFGVWLARVLTRTQEELVSSPLDGPILIFIILAFFSFVAGTAHAGITKDILRHFVEVILAIVLYFVVVNSVTDKRGLKWTVLALMLAGFASASIGIVLYFLPRELTVRLLSALRIFHYPSGWGVLRFIEDNPLLPMRAISTSIDPNVLGGLLILVTALTAPQLFTERPVLKKVLVAPMLAVMLSCLLLTFSRGAFVGLAAASLFLAAFRYRRLLVAVVLVGLLILILPQTQTYVQHFIAGTRGQDVATQMRFGEYKDALTLISRYPWFGVGFSGAPSIDLYIGVSSVYLLMAENMGLVGLGSFLLIMLLYFVHGWRARRALASNPEGEAILLGLLAAIVGAMVGGVFDHYFFNLDFPHSVSLFWLYVALTIATTKVYLPSPEQPRG